MKKPLLFTPVTMPSVVTGCPANGDVRPVPCTTSMATVGGGTAGPHTLAGNVWLRGNGVPVMKSALLLSLSMHPSPRRRTARVFDGAGADVPPSPQPDVAP